MSDDDNASEGLLHEGKAGVIAAGEMILGTQQRGNREEGVDEWVSEWVGKWVGD